MGFKLSCLEKHMKKPKSTLNQLKHIKIVAPVCPICNTRVYSLTDNTHIKGKGH